MDQRYFPVVCVVVAGAVLCPMVSAAQSTAPRTPWGQPDLRGIWDFRSLTPLQRPEDLGDQVFLTEEEAATIERETAAREEYLLHRPAIRTEAGTNVDRAAEGELPDGTFVNGSYGDHWLDRGTTIETRRTSLIVDPPNGRMPSYTADGQRQADARAARRQSPVADSWFDFSPYDRCILGFNAGPPMTPGAYNNNMQLFQTPDHVAIVTEMVHTARIVPLDDRPDLPAELRQWSGDSRGHWDGDTLVLETRNFAAKRRWRVTTESMHLVERLTRVDEDTLLYSFTVTDPETWTAPWTAEVPMRRNDDLMYDYACYEGNYSMGVMLAGKRAEERAAAQTEQGSR